MLRSIAFLRVLPLTLSIGTCFVGSTGASAQGRCLVADPTGTPLNVRNAPNGQILETLGNGTLVTIINRSSVRGKTWVYVGMDRGPIGWVFGDYLDCNAEDLGHIKKRENEIEYHIDELKRTLKDTQNERRTLELEERIRQLQDQQRALLNKLQQR